jgi:glycosyltransferase involved in cell wall biosynthesis
MNVASKFDIRQPPKVSVIMANHNGAAYLAHSIASVLKQSLKDIEIIVADDASTDRSVEITRELLAHDPRIRLLTNDRNTGPAAARNRALDVAKGEWIAIVDSDDLIHPTRLSTLVAAAERNGADIVGDDLLIFDSNHGFRPKPLLTGPWARRQFWVSACDYLRLNRLYGRGPILGYVKPVIRSSFLAANSARYNEALWVGEDYHFVLALLRAGAKFLIIPQLSYFYRKHTASVSHRLRADTLQALKAADVALSRDWPISERRLRAALKRRIQSVDIAMAFDNLLNCLRARNWPGAVRVVVSCPKTLPRLLSAFGERTRRIVSRLKAVPSNRSVRQVCILSRQRVVGRTNGSSSYLLDLADAVAGLGFDVHFLSPTPKTLGRWPYLSLFDDLSVFRSIKIRGTFRLGRRFISPDPSRFIRGTLAIVDAMMMRTGVTSKAFFKKDPYSIAQPLTRADQLFLARHARQISDYLIADYCFLTDALPFALRSDAKSSVIMHDFISSRRDQFSAISASGLETNLTEDDECEMLGRADSILAIQWEEAKSVQYRLPNHQIIVAPFAARPADEPQPGQDDRILFVGSAAAPNVDGLNWFVYNCWQKIKTMHPQAKLDIAGTVGRSMGPMPPGVSVMGLVKDLAPLYRDAAVIISPLRIGSGLKVKLIEALSHGKSIVGTTRTLQGVEEQLADTILVADEPQCFADAVVGLLRDREARTRLGSRGLDRIRAHFSHENCYGAFTRHVASALAAGSDPGPSRSLQYQDTTDRAFTG